MKEYQYPLNLDWKTDEMVLVMNMWDGVEQAYEKGISAETFLAIHSSFKTVVKSIGEERRLGREFEELSGYSLYHAVKRARENTTGRLKMEV